MIFKEKILELMPGVKSFKILAQALSPFTHTDVHWRTLVAKAEMYWSKDRQRRSPLPLDVLSVASFIHGLYCNLLEYWKKFTFLRKMQLSVYQRNYIKKKWTSYLVQYEFQS
jgi:hypothetical protein